MTDPHGCTDGQQVRFTVENQNDQPWLEYIPNLVAYEDALSWGYGAEIAARIADQAFPWLDAPVRRVASTDTFVAYAPELEDVILPQPEGIRAAMEEILRF